MRSRLEAVGVLESCLDVGSKQMSTSCHNLVNKASLCLDGLTKDRRFRNRVLERMRDIASHVRAKSESHNARLVRRNPPGWAGIRDLSC